MMDLTWGPWLVLLLLGAGHGLNPGMGWLFAVALGMQEGRGAAVTRALGPLAAGHALAVVLAVTVAALLDTVLPARALELVVAAVLLGFGLYRFVVNRHPRFGGMRVGPRDLTLWSFLMASAHGAGVMVAPVMLKTQPRHDHTGPLHASLLSDPALDALATTAVHTAGYLLVTGVIALLVYRRLGLRLLRSAWINLDVIWSVALVVTAVVVLL